MTGYEAFATYHVLKLHFTTSYDYFMYNGKCNINIETFEKRKDKYHFYKLSRKYSEDDYKEFVISGMLHDDRCWAGTLFEESTLDAHVKRKAVIESLTYNFKNDCKHIAENGKINCQLKTEGDYPKLLNVYLHREINLETICILNKLMNFLPMWNKKIKDDIRWPIISRKIEKYTPFINFEKSKFKRIALEEFK